MRNLPSEDISSSPAQRLMGRRTRTMLPIHGRLLKPEVPQETVRKLQERKEKQKSCYNRAARDLPPLQMNAPVLMAPKPGQHRWRPSVVVGHGNNRSYEVRTEDGGIYRRNRRHLRAYQPCVQETEVSENNGRHGDGNLYSYIRVPPRQDTGAVPRTSQNQRPRSPYMLRSRNTGPQVT